MHGNKATGNFEESQEAYKNQNSRREASGGQETL